MRFSPLFVTLLALAAAVPAHAQQGSSAVQIRTEQVAPGVYLLVGSGGNIVHFRDANVVHMGDTYVRDGFPFIDAGHGGSIDGMIAAVDTVLALIDETTKVIPGHGELATRADLAAYGEALRAMRKAVADIVLEGHPLEHILEFRPLQAQAEAWNQDRAAEDAFVETIYQGLTSR